MAQITLSSKEYDEMSRVSRNKQHRLAYGAGQAWHTDGHSMKNKYLSNILGADSLDCLFCTATIAADTIISLHHTGSYESGMLHATRTEDEDGNASVEFRDKHDKVLLNRQIKYTGGSKEFHDTYYIYNDLNELTVVLPPEASEIIRTSHPTSYASNESPLLRQYAYLYQYDHRGNCIAKKLPGCDWTLYIYDKANRLVLSQDGEQRKTGRCAFYIPDAFGRPTVNGVCSNTFSYASEPLRSTVVKATRGSGTGSLYGYTVPDISLSAPVVHGVSYYDDYSFIGTNGIPSSLEYVTPPSGYGTRHAGSNKGLLTGTVTARLDASGVTGYDYTTYYYDDRARIIQTRKTNHLGGTDVEYVAYNFVGDPVKRRRVHTASGKDTQTEVYSYTYDHAGRLLTTKYQLGSGAEVTLVACTYDDLGRLKTKAPHGNDTNRLTYSYNLRGWVTGISGNKFSQSLYYTDGSGTPCYNGNISSMTWKVGNETTLRGYKFTYDGLSRMLNAAYGEGTTRPAGYLIRLFQLPVCLVHLNKMPPVSCIPKSTVHIYLSNNNPYIQNTRNHPIYKATPFHLKGVAIHAKGCSYPA